MIIKDSFICLHNISFYAYHGVSQQERIVGNFFHVDLKLKVDFSAALNTDNVNDTVSYADVYQSVSEEMNIPSQLLEHAGGRIVNRLFNDYNAVQEIEIRLSKQNPPMGADIKSAGIEMHCLRSMDSR